VEVLKSKYIVPVDIAYLYLLSGNKEGALDYLEKGFEVQDPNMPYIVRPGFASLGSEPRYQDLLRKLNLSIC